MRLVSAILLELGSARSRQPHLLNSIQFESAAPPGFSQENDLQSEDQEQPYQSIFTHAGDGLILIEPETGPVVVANPAACTMHGSTRVELIGLQPTTYFHTDSYTQTTEWVQEVKSGNMFEATLIHIQLGG